MISTRSHHAVLESRGEERRHCLFSRHADVIPSDGINRHTSFVKQSSAPEDPIAGLSGCCFERNRLLHLDLEISISDEIKGVDDGASS